MKKLVSPTRSTVNTFPRRDVMRVSKYGNALFVCIPAAAAREIGIKQHDFMVLVVKRGKVVYSRIDLEKAVRRLARRKTVKKA